MALTVATNTGALMAQAAASSVNKEMEMSMERLSTGKRLNGARDDAAGVAIASRLSAEIRGTNMAIRNAMDGQALIDTAEGAHQEIENILQRMRELAVQAANDTNDSNDRANLQLEIDQLTTEIDRIASTTTWAGQKLIDGSGSFAFQVGSKTTSADSISTSLNAMDAAGLAIGVGGTTTAANSATLVEVGNNALQVGGTPAAGDIYHFTVANQDLAVRVDALEPDITVTDVAAQTNGTTVTFDSSTNTLTASTSTAADKFDLVINGTTVEVHASTGNTAANNAADIAAAIGKTQLGITVTDNSDGTLTLAPQIGYSVSVDGGTTFTAQTAIAKNGIEGVATAIATEIGDLTASKYVGLTAAAGSDGSVTVTQAINFSAASWEDASSSSKAAALAANGKSVTFTGSNAVINADEVKFTINGEAITTGVLATTDQFADEDKGTVAKLQAVIDANTKLNGLGLVVSQDGSSDIVVTATALTTTLIKDVSSVPNSTTTATSGVSVATSAGAIDAITKLDTAIQTVNTQRATLGAVSNRLDSTVNNLTNISSNLQAGRGRIEDADFAAETTNLAKTQILQQASTAMLAQANASKQNVLSLLQG